MAISKAATLANFSSGGALIVDSTEKRIGVGTTPAVSLDVLGNVEAVGVITASTGFYGELQTAAQPGITSVGTLASLDVTGNATIGGVLTYDDVTNIDSVGVITARSGIHVTNGSVGVGTVTPNRKLVISQANSTAYSGTDFDQNYHVLKLNNFTDSKTVGMQFLIGSNGEAAITATETSDGATDLIFGTRGSGNRAERVRITSAGLVGIGTADPSVNDGTGLHIAGTSAGIKLQNLNNSDWAYIEYADESNTTKYIQGYRDASGLYAIRPGTSLNAVPGISLDSTGKVTAAQSSSNIGLELHATTSGRGSQIKIHNDHGVQYVGTSGDTSGNLIIWQESNADILFSTNNTQRLSITSTGLIDASSNTTAVALPTGTTAQRPSGTSAYIRKNTTNNALEYHNGTNWVEIITDYFPTGSTTLG